MKNRTYKAVLFHPEGDFVTDFTNRNEIEDVWDMVNDMGSRWIFYPIVFVATDTTIVDTPTMTKSNLLKLSVIAVILVIILMSCCQY
jgi:hypothetical protein